MIDLEQMAKEHENLFPNATLESQVWKLEEEISEFAEARTDTQRCQECADILIVCCGLYRWCPLTARIIFRKYFYDAPSCLNKEIDEEVNRKWQINLKRKWEWNGKTYHHIGEDE